VQVTVHNGRTSRLTGWLVSWTLPTGTDIRDLWNGTLSRRGSTATVSDAGWNALLEENASTSFGLNEIRTADRVLLPVVTCRPAAP
jgi:cellulase/cellobiase CelA1